MGSRRKLFAGRPEKNMFLKHTNTLAVLPGIAIINETASIGKQLFAGIPPINFYYHKHLVLINEAVRKKFNAHSYPGNKNLPGETREECYTAIVWPNQNNQLKINR